VAAEGAVGLAGVGHALAQTGEQAVDGVAVEAGEQHDLHRRQVGRHAPQEPAENGLRDPRTHDIAVLHGKSAYPDAPGEAQLVMTHQKYYHRFRITASRYMAEWYTDTAFERSLGVSS